MLPFPYRGTEAWGNQCLQRDLDPATNFKTVILLSLIFLVLFIKKNPPLTLRYHHSHHNRSMLTTAINTKTLFCELGVLRALLLAARQVLLGCEAVRRRLQAAGLSQLGPCGSNLSLSTERWACTQQQLKVLVGIPLPAHHKWDKRKSFQWLSIYLAHHTAHRFLTLWGEICDTVLPFCPPVLRCFPATLINSHKISLRFGFLGLGFFKIKPKL